MSPVTGELTVLEKGNADPFQLVLQETHKVRKPYIRMLISILVVHVITQSKVIELCFSFKSMAEGVVNPMDIILHSSP